MNALVINAHASMDGTTHGCIYTTEGNGAAPELCYTYRFKDGRVSMMIWYGNELVIEYQMN